MYLLEERKKTFAAQREPIPKRIDFTRVKGLDPS
jgi:hypothetical protein